jgi:hypothetical protein
MDYNTIGIILYVLGLFILITVFSIGRAATSKLKGIDYGLQVTLPNIIGLLIMLLGSVLIFYGADDLFFVTIIPITAIGGIYVSLISIMNSAYKMRWQGS